jgi:hypothetical protein
VYGRLWCWILLLLLLLLVFDIYSIAYLVAKGRGAIVFSAFSIHLAFLSVFALFLMRDGVCGHFFIF